MPQRFQISRKKGWRKPVNGVIVARPTKWGNPYLVSKSASRKQAVAAFEKHLAKMPARKRDALLAPLRGKDLGCWCPLDEPCHADVLLKWAKSA